MKAVIGRLNHNPVAKFLPTQPACHRTPFLYPPAPHPRFAPQEMERTAKMMQEDMPLTFQDMQRTSKEFEILGKQLNYLAGVVVSARCCVCSLALWWGASRSATWRAWW